MRPITWQSLSLLLMLLALPLIVAGYAVDVPALVVAGVVAVALGGLIPPGLRFLGPDAKEDA